MYLDKFFITSGGRDLHRHRTTPILETTSHLHDSRTVKMWTDLHIFPETNPLHRNTDRIRKFRRYHCSPLYQIADALKTMEMDFAPSIRLH